MLMSKLCNDLKSSWGQYEDLSCSLTCERWPLFAGVANAHFAPLIAIYLFTL